MPGDDKIFIGGAPGAADILSVFFCSSRARPSTSAHADVWLALGLGERERGRVSQRGALGKRNAAPTREGERTERRSAPPPAAWAQTQTSRKGATATAPRRGSWIEGGRGLARLALTRGPAPLHSTLLHVRAVVSDASVPSGWWRMIAARALARTPLFDVSANSVGGERGRRRAPLPTDVDACGGKGCRRRRSLAPLTSSRERVRQSLPIERAEPSSRRRATSDARPSQSRRRDAGEKRVALRVSVSVCARARRELSVRRRRRRKPLRTTL